MGFEPQKIFVGLIDFFSVLLPGALLTYILRDDLGMFLLGNHYQTLTDTERIAIFLFSSYLLGHFIFLLGSLLLDDWYDAIRKATKERKQNAKQQKSGLWSRLDSWLEERVSAPLNKWLAAHLFKKDVDKTVDLAVKIKEYYLDPLEASSAINAFQWSKARLTLQNPEAMAAVQRFEADSKFFRSLVVVLYILVLLFGMVKNQPIVALVCVPLLVLAFWRYVEQRLKSTNQAYWYLITLEGQNSAGYRQPLRRLTHAGGVVYWLIENQVKYLLVQATDSPDEWVLPKGHIEPNEDLQETAQREVLEETGVRSQIRRELDDISLVTSGEHIRVRFYLMEKIGEGVPKDNREHHWLPLKDAIDKASYDETRTLLKIADNFLASQPTRIRRE
jgi:8-oxo-dGTP pyrophosphatase MutT (NUDIX family)